MSVGGIEQRRGEGKNSKDGRPKLIFFFPFAVFASLRTEQTNSLGTRLQIAR